MYFCLLLPWRWLATLAASHLQHEAGSLHLLEVIYGSQAHKSVRVCSPARFRVARLPALSCCYHARL